MKSTVTGQENQVISSLASTANTQENEGKVFRVGSNNIIHIYDAENLATTNYTLTQFATSSMTKIQVSKTE